MNGHFRIADVLFYFYLRFGEELFPLALVNLFSIPDEELLKESSGTVYLSKYIDEPESLWVFSIKSIHSVVSMFPDIKVNSIGAIESSGKFSLLRHPFLALAERQGYGLELDEFDQN